MTFGRWLWDKTVPVVLNICGIIAVALFTGFSAEWYIAAVIAAGWIAALAAYLAVGYVSEKRRVARVRSVVLSAEDKFLLSEIVPEPTRVEDRLYYEIMRLQGRAAIERVSAAEAAAEERKEDTEEWVHELKIPLTAIRLICSRSDGEDFREVEKQADRIFDHTERALYLAKSDHAENDKLIRRCDLSAVVSEVLGDNKRMLIDAGASVRTDVVGSVYTDPKWLAFVLRQLLMNAVQYARGAAEIEISSALADGGTTLTVRDRGIGIPACDLPRIFDKGFTGTTGRRNKKSTGLGLYLCKRMCDSLDIDISARSEPGDTSFILKFRSVRP